MKTTQSFLVFTFILFSIYSASAQYGNGYGYGNGYNSNGRMNSGMSQLSQPSEPQKPKEIPAEVAAAKIMEDMKPALNLDELQEIAITNILKESLREQGVLRKQEYSQEDQIKNYKALAETTDQKINQFLNKEQKEKYLVYKEERLNQKSTKEKSKSKKKDKKEKQE